MPSEPPRHTSSLDRRRTPKERHDTSPNERAGRFASGDHARRERRGRLHGQQRHSRSGSAAGAVAAGMATTLEQAPAECPAVPALVLVSEPQDWTDFVSGGPRRAGECDLGARLYGMRRMHKSYAGSGTICTGAAAHPRHDPETSAARGGRSDRHRAHRSSLGCDPDRGGSGAGWVLPAGAAPRRDRGPPAGCSMGPCTCRARSSPRLPGGPHPGAGRPADLAVVRRIVWGQLGHGLWGRRG